MTRHEFGGVWTEQKLEKVHRYLTAYLEALKKQPFNKIYIDAFAGTGYRHDRHVENHALVFPDLEDESSNAYQEGSARIALRLNPGFDTYIFIEKRRPYFDKLLELPKEFPHKNVSCLLGDANEVIPRICQETDWDSNRAVLFLDPYAMQVDWTTIQAIAETRAIDLWVLYPLAVGANRLLINSASNPDDIPLSWRRKLDRFLGTDKWFEEFYRTEIKSDLFGEVTITEKTAKLDVLGRFFVSRLKEIFVGVAEHPLPLFNDHGAPMFLLCFAAGNERGAPIAVRIANHILKM